MSVKAQRNYYNMPPTSRVLSSRIEAINSALPKGSTIIDIGCNDGSISNALIESGAVSKSYCYDRENIIQFSRPEIEFCGAGDFKEYDLNKLPDADGVLLLNILHHIVGSSWKRAKEIIDYLIERYTFVFVDMGSFTEQGEWGWRKKYDLNWHSDAEMWNFLFEKAQWRFKLLRYPTQGKGQRTLWKLYKQPYPLDQLRVIETYKRPPAAWPDNKKLIPLSQVGDTTVVNNVEFSLARSQYEDLFWIKKYTDHNANLRTELEFDLAKQADLAVQFVNSRRRRNLRAVLPITVLPDGGLISLYEPDLAAGSIVHFHDWPVFFTPEDCRAAAILGTRPVRVIKGIPEVKLIHACDYQACAAWDGLAILDFEPNNWLLSLHSGDEKREEESADRVISVNPEWIGKKPILAAFDVVAELNKDRVRCFDLGRYHIYLNLSEYNTMLGRIVGTFEPRKFALISAFLKPGDVFLDIGGNKGDFALFAAGIVGAAGKSICFEPHPDNVESIKRSAAKSDFANITVVEACVASSNGSVTLHIGRKSGWHSMFGKGESGTMERPSFTLDKYLQENNIDRVNLIKIDVEGAELEVLRGAMNTLALCRPLMLVDVHKRLIGSPGVRFLSEFAKAADYRIFNERDLDEFPASKLTNAAIFVPAERAEEVTEKAKEAYSLRKNGSRAGLPLKDIRSVGPV